MKTTLALFAAILAVASTADDFNVPQGGGKLPTIALVSCLAAEDAHALGQFCRTTYRCAGGAGQAADEGVLWEGLRYHNGRRVTLESDAIANGRGCVLDIEDPAVVQFFTGYRPLGPNGEVVAFVRSGRAASSSAQVDLTTPPNNMLGQFLHAVQAATLEEWIDRVNAKPITTFGDCDNQGCDRSGRMLEGTTATGKTLCYVQQRIGANIGDALVLRYLAEDWATRIPASYRYDGTPVDNKLDCNDCDVVNCDGLD